MRWYGKRHLLIPAALVLGLMTGSCGVDSEQDKAAKLEPTASAAATASPAPTATVTTNAIPKIIDWTGKTLDEAVTAQNATGYDVHQTDKHPAEGGRALPDRVSTWTVCATSPQAGKPFKDEQHKLIVWLTAPHSECPDTISKEESKAPAPRPKPTPEPTETSSSGGSSSGSSSGGTSTQRGVHPGAFCSPPGAMGYTSAGTLMTCATTPNSPDRARWHAA
ncbi:hypothetical protein [Streptomyces sp. NBC_01445]|uniref:hypothetical protein n=1 Tax=Streptomyces sp. NBC_01445 TaxID=2903869 RepID=UPI002DD9F6D6|nr:hypothetical protein [Streptomyces sp. NBC_01445]WSE01961.1 hypothetical protein OG574_00050 [Streptomyces sp. NBC_01445]WSE10370.1 hypothetical protein OG574_47965 [Streptomyces sp. NBC_01445]WSE11064.1 hypothetical protein OG574_48060 [Streptomyces sp. NBC_01445]